MSFALLVAVVEEVDGFQLAFHLPFFLVGHVLEGRAVAPEVETDEFHDALARHDVAAIVADDVDDVLCIVLQPPCLVDMAAVESVLDAFQAASVVVARAADATLRASHGHAG